jgi:dihydrofolate reductase
MRVHLIWAQARNRAIGLNGALPWHLPEDLRHFKEKTAGCPVIMGRKTWQSLPPKFKPLPGRRNIVLTRSDAWHEVGAEPCKTLQEALLKCAYSDEVWVIGGAEVYAQALSLADTAEVTEIDASFTADAFAPALGPNWVKSAGAPQVSSSGLKFSFDSYRKLGGDPLPPGS